MSNSSIKEEYKSMTLTTCDIIYPRYLLQDLCIDHPQQFTLYCVNQATIHIVVNLIFHETTKHIEIDCHVVREITNKGKIKTACISSENYIEDIFTKVIGKVVFRQFVGKLSVIGI